MVKGQLICQYPSWDRNCLLTTFVFIPVKASRLSVRGSLILFGFLFLVMRNFIFKPSSWQKKKGRTKQKKEEGEEETTNKNTHLESSFQLRSQNTKRFKRNPYAGNHINTDGENYRPCVCGICFQITLLLITGTIINGTFNQREWWQHHTK